jgi:hypothetical protein
MLIWSGHGWVGYLFMFAAFAVGHYAFGDKEMWRPLPSLLLILGSSIGCYLAGRWLNRGLPRKFLDRNDNGSSVGHTVGFIRLEYAGGFTLLVFAIFWLEHAGFFD